MQDCNLQLSDEDGHRCYPLMDKLLCYNCHIGRIAPGSAPLSHAGSGPLSEEEATTVYSPQISPSTTYPVASPPTSPPTASPQHGREVSFSGRATYDPSVKSASLPPEPPQYTPAPYNKSNSNNHLYRSSPPPSDPPPYSPHDPLKSSQPPPPPKKGSSGHYSYGSRPGPQVGRGRRDDNARHPDSGDDDSLGGYLVTDL